MKTRNPDWVSTDEVYSSYILEQHMVQNRWLILAHAKTYEAIEDEMWKAYKKGGIFQIAGKRIDDGSLDVIFSAFSSE